MAQIEIKQATSDGFAVPMDRRAKYAAYVPQYDGIDADPDNGQQPYDGDDFADRTDYSAEIEACIEKSDAPSVMHRLMKALDLSFPGDLVVNRAADDRVYAPWTATRLSILLGVCDAIAKQLYRRSPPDQFGQVREAGLMPQRDRALKNAERLIGSRNPQAWEWARDRLNMLDDQINYLEEMLEAAATVYDDAAFKAETRSLLPEYLPVAYERPHIRMQQWAQQNAASPMSPLEYDLLVRIRGKEGADAELERRQAEWAKYMGAKETTRDGKAG